MRGGVRGTRENKLGSHGFLSGFGMLGEKNKLPGRLLLTYEKNLAQIFYNSSHSTRLGLLNVRITRGVCYKGRLLRSTQGSGSVSLQVRPGDPHFNTLLGDFYFLMQVCERIGNASISFTHISQSSTQCSTEIGCSITIS